MTVRPPAPRLGELSTSKAQTGDELAKSMRLAGWLGPVVIAVALSEAMNFHIWATNSAPLTYLVGILWFVAGLSIVKVHNQWTAGWPVAMSLMGWFLVLGGLFRMFLPEAQQGNQNTPELGTYAFDLVLLAIGTLLTFRAYWPKSRA